MSDDERRGSKRTRQSGDYEVRLLIPSRHAGSVIGKQGSIISKLRSDHQASINIPDCPGPERIVSMYGPESNVIKLAEAVVQALDESAPSKGEADVRLLVHQSQCGAIIGKGGAKVKELREQCGGQVKVYVVPCPGSTDRVVQITGSLDRVCVTLTTILEILAQCPIKGVEGPYNPFNAEEVFAHEYGGWGDPQRGGRGGSFPPAFGDMRGDMRGPRGRMGGPGMFGGRMGGPPMGRDAPFPPRGGRRDGNGYGRDDDYEMGGGGGGRGGYNQSLMGGGELTTTTQVTIPKDAAGAIIGKGGLRIRRIRQESGCNISIEDSKAGSDDRIITITGNDHQIKHAQYLLQQSVREYGPAHVADGGRGGRDY